MSRRHPVFKGCSRLPMFMGVPLTIFLLVSGIFLLVGVWGLYLISPFFSLALLAVYVPLLFIMRNVTKRDDQRLQQYLLRVGVRIRQRNRAHWGGVAYSPLVWKRRAAP